MRLHTTTYVASRRIAHANRLGTAAAAALFMLSAASCGRFGFSEVVDSGRGPTDTSPEDASGDRDAEHAPGPVLVQQATFAVPSAQSLMGALPTASILGNLLVIIAADVGGPLLRPSGGGVTRWWPADGAYRYYNVEIWYGVVSVSSSSPMPVTIRSGPPAGTCRLHIMEWSGLVAADTDVLDDAHGNSGTSRLASAMSITTTHPVDLILFGVSDADTSTFGMPTDGSWSALQQIKVLGDSIQQSWFQTISAPGSHAPTVTDDSPTMPQWDAAIAAFKVAP